MFLAFLAAATVAVGSTGNGHRAWTPEDAAMFCSAVDSQVEEGRDAHYPDWALFVWQEMAGHWAGVLPTDTEEQIAAKMRAFFNSHLAELRCPTPNFDPWNGNVLKLAIARQSSDFIDAMIVWKVDLNLIDPRDGQTVLDYVAMRRDRAGATPWATTLTRYYDRLRRAGALHANEINRGS